MTEFDQESMYFHGRILTGTHKHFCPDFDYFPIDETCSEYHQFCTCEVTDE